MQESELHKLIIEKKFIQSNMLSLLGIEQDYYFKHEDQYPNGLYADFTIIKNNKVKGIVECKGSNIGVNDFVRGIGQIIEYQYFADNNLSIKGYEYEETLTIYCFPSSIIKNKNFNIGLFGYPEKCRLIELNEKNYNVRQITKEELKIFADASKNNKITISPYYIRDNRLFELYLCLKYLQMKKLCGTKFINRRTTEENFLKKLETPNNRNWRNAFISLSSLGFINSSNLPTDMGAIYANMSYEEFAYEIYKCYIKEYLDLLTQVLVKINKTNITYKDISTSIFSEYNNKEVLFLTDSENRYLSSWMNILRDDFGAISFASRSNERRLNYRIDELTDVAIKNKIKENSVAYIYIEKFYEIINNLQKGESL